MTLADVCRRLDELDPDHTIYVRQPWTPDSAAVVAPEPDEGGLPPEAEGQGVSYFIEVYLAREFLADWQASLPAPASELAACRRLIAYATDDA